MSTSPCSEVEGSEGDANKSYIRNSTSDGTSGSTTSATIAKVCSYQSEWQSKEEQIKVLQEKAAEAQ
jgi:hypothetical protein